MTALIVIGSIVAYLVVGAVYARANAVRYYQRRIRSNRRQYSYEDNIRSFAAAETKFMLAAALVLWPLMLPFDMVFGPVARWFYAPITNRRGQAAQLRADAKTWREKRYDGTPAEREMADKLARMCDQRATELDL